MKWSELAERVPRLADLGRQQLEEPGWCSSERSVVMGLLASVRWSRCCGGGTSGYRCSSGRARSLTSVGTQRVLVHSIVTGRDGSLGEYKVRGRALEAPPGTVQDAYADEVRQRLGWEPTPGRFHLLSIDIEDVTFVRYEEASGDQFVTRWPEGREFVRRGDGGTALLEPEPYRGLLTPD